MNCNGAWNIWSLLIISTFDTCTDLHISICCKSYHALCWKDCTSQANSYRMMLKFYKFSTICENISTNAACSVRMQQIHKIISTKSSIIAIHKNVDPRKFSTIRYVLKLRVWVLPWAVYNYSMATCLLQGCISQDAHTDSVEHCTYWGTTVTLSLSTLYSLCQP